jgi:energy-coupling factor transport system permease protein
VLDARVWLVWALSLLLTASYTRNPLYGVVLLWVTSVVGSVCGPEREEGTLPLSPLRFALVAIPLGAVFNAFAVRLGETVVLQLPAWLPLLGGAVTVEGLASGAVNGLALTVIFSAFAVFNRVTYVRDLIRLAPRAFHESGVVLSIALTFVPQTTRSLRRIREAQALRGLRVRGVRDWLPIVVPLLISGLERAIGLAEAMVARGYGAVGEEEQTLPLQGLLAAGLLVVLSGWLGVLFLPGWRWVAASVVVAGSALLVGGMWLAGRSVEHTVYRRRSWRWGDSLALAGIALGTAVAVTRREVLYWSPYPRVDWPGFDPWVGLGLLGLLAPAVVGAAGEWADD